GAPSGGGAVVQIGARSIVGSEDADGVGVQRISNHHPSRWRATKAYDAGDDRAITRQGLISEIETVRGAKDPLPRSIHGERAVGERRTAGQADRTHVSIEPARSKVGCGNHSQADGSGIGQTAGYGRDGKGGGASGGGAAGQKGQRAGTRGRVGVEQRRDTAGQGRKG